MAVEPRYVAHKSALARLRYPRVSAVLAPLILAGEVATCGIVELEILYSGRRPEATFSAARPGVRGATEAPTLDRRLQFPDRVPRERPDAACAEYRACRLYQPPQL